MIGKRCKFCNTLYGEGTTCPKCGGGKKRYERSSRNKERAQFYFSKAWKLARQRCLAFYYGIDLWELGLSGQLIPAVRPIVHHIYEYSRYPGKALDPQNLIVVGTANHNAIHEWYDSGRFQEALEIINTGKIRFEELKNGNGNSTTPTEAVNTTRRV